VWIAIRPEKVSIGRSGEGVAGTIRQAVYQGSTTLYDIVLASGAEMRVARQDDGTVDPLTEGTPVRLRWSAGSMTVLTS